VYPERLKDQKNFNSAKYFMHIKFSDYL